MTSAGNCTARAACQCAPVRSRPTLSWHWYQRPQAWLGRPGSTGSEGSEGSAGSATVAQARAFGQQTTVMAMEPAASAPAAWTTSDPDGAVCADHQL